MSTVLQSVGGFYSGFCTTGVSGGAAMGTTPSMRELPPALPIKLVARLQGYTLAVFTAWHRIQLMSNYSLHHSRSHSLRHPKLLAPKDWCGHPAGHPKLLQLENAPVLY